MEVCWGTWKVSLVNKKRLKYKLGLLYKAPNLPQGIILPFKNFLSPPITHFFFLTSCLSFKIQLLSISAIKCWGDFRIFQFASAKDFISYKIRYVFKEVATDMRYFARSKFFRSYTHKKNFSLIWQLVFKWGYIFCQGR